MPSDEQTTAAYTFGDSQVAGDRLALVAELFEPSSTALLELAAPPATDVALDLGCGPGFTTALLARVTGAARTVGLDASPTFVARARAARRSDAIDFAVHDVVADRLPDPRADIVHARFLLAHLPDPLARLADWSRCLSTGGRLVSDETERIDTDVDAFVRYEHLGRAMVAQRGADLQVGALLRTASPPAGTRLLDSTCREIRPSTANVARIFGMNFATWRHDAFVIDTVPARELDALAEALTELERSPGEGELTFCNRQVIYERS